MAEEWALGAHLRGARAALSLAADQVLEATRIAPQLIVAPESDHLEAVPAPAYVRGFIRAHCERVGVAPVLPRGPVP